MMETFFSAGCIIGPAVGGLLFEAFGYKGPLLGTAGVNFLSVLIGIFMIPSRREETSVDGEFPARTCL